MRIGDKNCYGARFEPDLEQAGCDLLRPARKSENRGGSPYFKPLRQIIESVNDTLQGQPDLERHGGRTPSASPPASSNDCRP